MPAIVQRGSYSCFRCEHRFKTHHAGFLEEHILKDHYNSHSYKCSECDCRFGTKLATIWHIDEHHDGRERGRQIILTHDEDAEYLEIAIHREVMEYQRRFLHKTADEWKQTVAAARLKRYNWTAQVTDHSDAVAADPLVVKVEQSDPATEEEQTDYPTSNEQVQSSQAVLADPPAIQAEQSATFMEQDTAENTGGEEPNSATEINNVIAEANQEDHAAQIDSRATRTANANVDLPSSPNIQETNAKMRVDAADKCLESPKLVGFIPAAARVKQNAISTEDDIINTIASDGRVYCEDEATLPTEQQQEHQERGNDIPAMEQLLLQDAEQEHSGSLIPPTSNVEASNENMRLDTSEELEVSPNVVDPDLAAAQDEQSINSTEQGTHDDEASDERVNDEEESSLLQQNEQLETGNEIPILEHPPQDAEQEQEQTAKPSFSPENVEEPRETVLVDSSDESVETDSPAGQEEQSVTDGEEDTSTALNEHQYGEDEPSVLQQQEHQESQNDMPTPEPLPPQDALLQSINEVEGVHTAVQDRRSAASTQRDASSNPASDQYVNGEEEQSFVRQEPQESLNDMQLPEHLPLQHADEELVESQGVFARQCKQCERWISDSPADLLRHASTVHANLILYECRGCEISIDDKQLIEQHMNEMHEGDMNLVKDCRADFEITLKKKVDSFFGGCVQKQVPAINIQQVADCAKSWIAEVKLKPKLPANKRKHPLNKIMSMDEVRTK